MTDANSREINLSVDGIAAQLRIRRATIGDDMRRSMLAAHAVEKPFDEPSDQIVAMIIYPRCVACLVEGKIGEKNAKEISVEEFIDLPYQIGDAWIEAAIDLNPGWKLGGEPEEGEGSKKKE